jgi:hypothetical protein
MTTASVRTPAASDLLRVMVLTEISVLLDRRAGGRS